MTSFDEKKTTQAAAFFLKKSGGAEDYMKLLKLLYISDREALLRWGRPITFDKYVSMKRGPVLSSTYDLISDGPEPGKVSFWSDHITATPKYAVKLVQDTGDEELSPAEIELMEEVYRKYGHMDKWELVKLLHKILPEWQDPGNSSTPISYRDILKAGGRTELEVAAVEDDLEHLSFARIFLKER